MRRVWAVTLALTTATPAAAQMTSEAQPDVVAAMSALEMMVGEWSGTSTTRLGPDRKQTSYDAVTDSFRMRSYRAGQGWVDAELDVDASTVRRTLESPAGPIRFTADFSKPDRWIETGEIERGGQ